MSLMESGGLDAPGASVAGRGGGGGTRGTPGGRAGGPIQPVQRLPRERGSGRGQAGLALACRGDSGCLSGTLAPSPSAQEAPGSPLGLTLVYLPLLLSGWQGRAWGPEARLSFFVKTSGACAQHQANQCVWGDRETSPPPPRPLGWVLRGRPGPGLWTGGLYSLGHPHAGLQRSRPLCALGSPSSCSPVSSPLSTC